MTLAKKIDIEVIDNEEKLNGEPLVTPETRSGGGLVVVVFFEVFAEEIVSKFPDFRRL